MADTNGLFWNSNNGDRTYNADSLSEWLKKFFTTGIFNGELQVTPVGGMGINVAPGYVNVHGKVRYFDTDTLFTVPTANSTYPRIDTVVVQADYTNRKISMVYVQGTYSGNNPSPQAPVRDTGIYQLVLAQIRVNAGATEITTANITDTRADSDLCGWVTGTVDHVAVSQLTEQAQAEFATWFEHMKDQLSEDAAGNLQLEVDTLSGSIAPLEHAIADTDHAKGSYVTIGNQMYKVTNPVTAGDTFEVGVNIELTNAGAELASLNKGLTPETLSLSSSYTLTNASFRMGKLVVVSCKIAGLNGMGNIEAATIPSAYAPKSEIPLVGTTNNGVLITGWIRANTGVVVIAPRSQLSNSEARVLAVYHI